MQCMLEWFVINQQNCVAFAAKKLRTAAATCNNLLRHPLAAQAIVVFHTYLAVP